MMFLKFTFGSTYVQLNPNYRKFDRMDPMTWKKEGISSHWTGMRGFRKKCCKVCCEDTVCSGCNTCKGKKESSHSISFKNSRYSERAHTI